MNSDQFKLAIKLLKPSDWAIFEELASVFLAQEFPELRTMAHPSGDGGRDSELFQPDGKPFIACQYSVQKDWKQKIRQTSNRIRSQFPTVRILIYLSNQQIGGQADELKRDLLENELSLDTRDRTWFLERANMGEAREHAAQRLIDLIAVPYLSGEGVISKPSSPLTTGEARAALLYLGLQLQDDISQKGLTKLSFDALVRAALRHTHSECRKTRSEIHEAIHRSLPSSDKQLLIKHTDSALSRLTKRYIRHWQKQDEFCLTHEEHQRILARLAELEFEESTFHDEIAYHCEQCLTEVGGKDEDIEDVLTRVPRVIERLLLRRGEAFVSAVTSDTLDRVGFQHLNDIILNDLTQHEPMGGITQHLPRVIATIVRNLLATPTEFTQVYLRRLSNSYTLFSFLRETPDVQTATQKLFSYGTIWLDTTVLLPIFAEQLEEDETQRRFSCLFRMCHEAGIDLRVTPGVLEEISSHMNFSYTCSQYDPSAWRGRTPFLYYNYLLTGKPRSEFPKWLSLFRGNERPEDDIAQFLSDCTSSDNPDKWINNLSHSLFSGNDLFVVSFS